MKYQLLWLCTCQASTIICQDTLITHHLRSYATKIALENHLTEPVIAYGLAIPTILPGGFIQLPPSICKLPLWQVTVPRQHEQGTCGLRSVTNVAALRDVLISRLPINARNIYTMALKYEHLQTESIDGLLSSDQIELARKLGLSYTYAMGFFPLDPIENKEINHYPFMIIESTELPMVDICKESEIIEDIFYTLHTQKNIQANFLCHLGDNTIQRGHSIAVSIIKREGRPTGMVYMDSNNMSVADHSQIAAYICYIYWQFVVFL